MIKFYIVSTQDTDIITKSDGKKILTLQEVSTQAIYEKDGSNEHIHVEKTKETRTNMFASGCCFVDIDVDLKFGKIKINDIINVHDSGTILNPLLAEAQINGGMSMSLGYALSEEMLVYEKTGKVLNDNWLDYKIPTAMDSPDFHVEFVDIKTPTGVYGNKALGEPLAVPPAVSIRNAVLNVTGYMMNEFPLTS